MGRNIRRRPDLMPPIFRRYGIFDTKLIMLPPTGGGRMEILRIFCQGQTSGNINFQSLRWRSRDRWVDMARSALDCSTARTISQDAAVAIPSQNASSAKHSTTSYQIIHGRLQIFMGLLALREANSRMMVPDGLLPELSRICRRKPN